MTTAEEKRIVVGVDRSIWGGPEVQSFSITSGDEPVDLEFVRRLPAGSVDDLTLGAVVPSTFAAVAHLAPGLPALEYLALMGGSYTVG
jgi:hypothetical protein